jgi:flagellar biosynthetic protein FliR
MTLLAGPVTSLSADLASTLALSGVNARALGLAWARAVPAVTLVPAFGLRAIPAPARLVIALALAASFFPALAPVSSDSSGSWPMLAITEAARGLPIAIAAAVPLWAATMAGGLADALRGASEAPAVPVVEGSPSPMGILLSLLASAIFLMTGGPARVALALAFRAPDAQPLVGAVDDIVGGIGLAVALGGPLLAAAVVLEVAAALIARAASPAQVHAMLAPLRALGILAVTAVVFERLAAALERIQ